MKTLKMWFTNGGIRIRSMISWLLLGEGLRYDLSCTPRAFFKSMPNCSVGPLECETKFSSKEIWYGLFKNAWFAWQPLI